MEYKLLEEQDLGLMLDFVDDENTKYSIDDLNPNYSSLLLKKLGIEKDDFKLKYYMLLDELF